MPEHEIEVAVARLDEASRSHQHQINELKKVGEIPATIAALQVKMDNIIDRMDTFDAKLSAIEAQPKARLNQITTALISAIAGAAIPTIIAFIFK